ncbi:MAG: preprotein translocase subunit SecG [Bacteroidota bacterium]
MPVIFTILIVIICALLVVVVLIQNPKGGGLDSSFGSAAQLGGVQKTTDFLEKSTWTLAIGLVVLCLSSAAFSGNNPNAAAGTTGDKYRDAAAPQQTQQPQAQPQAQPAQAAPADSAN